jgi:uncharacterized protein YecT (DUF1311 family)
MAAFVMPADHEEGSRPLARTVMRLAGSTLVVLLSLTPGAHAQDVACETAADQTTMTICAQLAYQDADGRLNDVYRALRARISEPGRDKLRTAQRAWLRWRDAQCAFETAGYADGSIHPMLLAMCLAALTQTQADRLAAQLDCEEGDLSCGGQ